MVSAPVQYTGNVHTHYTEVWNALDAAVASGGTATAGSTASVASQVNGVAATATENDVTPAMVDREVTGCYYCIPVDEEEPISTTKARSNAEAAARTFLDNLKSDASISYDDISAIVKQWKCKRNTKRERIHPTGQQWVYSDTFGLVWCPLLGAGQLVLFPRNTKL